MSRILKLIQAADALKRHTNKQLIPSFIFQNADGSYTADARLWSGRPHEPLDIHKSRHDTQEAALNAIDELAQKYPPEQPVPVFLGEELLDDSGTVYG